MRRYGLILSIAALLPASAVAADYQIDPSHTYPNFVIDHLGFSYVFGRFGRTEGRFAFDPQLKDASVTITIDADSVDTGHDKRDQNLRSPDFLNTAEYPEISFQSTEVAWDGSTVVTIEGELAMLGVVKPVTLNVTRMRCGVNPLSKKEACGFDAEATVSRSDWGMTYATPNLSDDIRLMLGVEGVKIEQ